MVERIQQRQAEGQVKAEWQQLPQRVSRSLREKVTRLKEKYFGHRYAHRDVTETAGVVEKVSQPAIVDAEGIGNSPNLEVLASQLSEQFLPPELRAEGIGTLANFSSNQTLHRGFREEVVAELGQQPDGYLVGVGAATLFALLYLFDADSCQGIIGVDIMPQPIMTGQVVVEMFKKNPTFEDFYRECTVEKMGEYFDQVVAGQTLEILSHVMRKIDKTALITQLGRVLREEIQEESAISHRVRKGAEAEDRLTSPFEKKRIIVLAAIKDRYAQLRHLAMSGKLAFVLADFSNPSFLAALKAGLPGYESARNVVHESNMVDHISTREDDYLATVDAMAQLSILDNGSSIFTGTTRAEKYDLQHSRHPFQYTYDQLAENFS